MTWLNDAEIKTAEDKLAESQQYVLNELKATIQWTLDEEARSRGYDNINSIAKFVGCNNVYREECEALAKWCAECWDVLDSSTDITTNSVLDKLPEFVFIQKPTIGGYIKRISTRTLQLLKLRR